MDRGDLKGQMQSSTHMVRHICTGIWFSNIELNILVLIIENVCKQSFLITLAWSLKVKSVIGQVCGELGNRLRTEVNLKNGEGMLFIYFFLYSAKYFLMSIIAKQRHLLHSSFGIVFIKIEVYSLILNPVK